MTIKVETVVVCDDIRQEQNGKHILIGVYAGNIVISRTPVNLRLMWWIQLLADEGTYKLEFRVVARDEAQLTRGTLNLTSKERKRSTIALPTPIQIQRDGPLRFEWRILPDGVWETVGEVDVVIMGQKEGPPVTAPVSA